MTDDAPRPRSRTWIAWTVFGLIVLVVFCAGWIVIRGIGAAVSLGSAAAGAKELRAMLGANESEGIQATAKRVEADAANAHTLTGDPIWRVAEFTPWLGGNLRAMRQVSEAADDIAADGMGPLLEAAKGADLGTLGISGGHIDLAPLAAIAPELAKAATVLAEAERSVRGIDTAGTVPVLADAVDKLVEEIDTAARATGQLAGAAELLPEMLGGEGSHTYLLVMQNNSELRSSGGIPGAFALLHAKDGTVTLGKQADTTDFRRFAQPVGELSEPMTALFGDDPVHRIQNTLNLPDFPTAAGLAATMWTKTEGGHLDGVIAVDAVVIGYLLDATGPVEVNGVTLTADNATDYLLGGVYEKLPDPVQSDAFFRKVAAQVFQALTDGSTKPRAILSAIAQAGDSERVRLWSSDAAIQSRIAATSLAGTRAADDADTANVAVLVNDTTGGKMDYYADAAVHADLGTCGDGGRSVLRVTVDWRSSAPADAATSLPDYVTGAGWWGVEPGITGTRIAVSGPAGWTATATSATGKTLDEVTTVDDGRAIVQYELRTPAGASQQVVVEFTAPDSRMPDVAVQATPMIRATPIDIGELACG